MSRRGVFANAVRCYIRFPASPCTTSSREYIESPTTMWTRRLMDTLEVRSGQVMTELAARNIRQPTAFQLLVFVVL